jgi:hypothetical protein
MLSGPDQFSLQAPKVKSSNKLQIFRILRHLRSCNHSPNPNLPSFLRPIPPTSRQRCSKAASHLGTFVASPTAPFPLHVRIKQVRTHPGWQPALQPQHSQRAGDPRVMQGVIGRRPSVRLASAGTNLLPGGHAHYATRILRRPGFYRQLSEDTTRWCPISIARAPRTCLAAHNRLVAMEHGWGGEVGGINGLQDRSGRSVGWNDGDAHCLVLPPAASAIFVHCHIVGPPEFVGFRRPPHTRTTDPGISDVACGSPIFPFEGKGFSSNTQLRRPGCKERWPARRMVLPFPHLVHVVLSLHLALRLPPTSSACLSVLPFASHRRSLETVHRPPCHRPQVHPGRRRKFLVAPVENLVEEAANLGCVDEARERHDVGDDERLAGDVGW